MKRRRFISGRQEGNETIPLAGYLVYIVMAVFFWIFAFLKFINATNKANMWTAMFYVILGLFVFLVVLADLKFNTTGKYWMDIPINIFNFEGMRWWHFAVGLVLGIVLLSYTALTHTLIIPLPMASSSFAVEQWTGHTQQAFMTGMVGSLENGAMVGFPVATIAAWGGFLFGRKRQNSKTGWAMFILFGIIASLLFGFVAVKIHSFVYPPSVMQVTAVSTFLFFSIGGIISTLTRNTIIFDVAHMTYNFFAVFLSLVSMTISLVV